MALFIRPLPTSTFTLRDLLQSVMPRLGQPLKSTIPRWPPDVFALSAYALRQASAYVNVLSNWPPQGIATWNEHCEAVAGDWRKAIEGELTALPDPVLKCWATVATGLDAPLTDIRNPDSSAAQALFALMAYSDQTCRTLAAIEKDSASLWFDVAVLIELRKHGSRSICEEIDPSRLRVLPKARVPQRGLTIRSLSLFAGLVEGPEIETTFLYSPQRFEDRAINVLVLPWPFQIRPSQFRRNARLPGEMGTMSGDFDFFTFENHAAGGSFLPALRALLEEASAECGPIGIVILPELALSAREATAVRKLLADPRYECVLITGVGSPGVSGSQRGQNRVQLYAPGLEPVEQEKHHRWKLDTGQIIQYSLGNSLYHAKGWWEHIDLSRRSLSFVRLAPWLNVCALICEDLARPDPAGDVIRAVAPNLVVSLLMDGPQLVSRWPSRHATTLAEDPGSSVLTVTSLGMSRLSRPANGPNRERVVALWKEEGSAPVEIELPHDRRAFVLSLSMKVCRDWSADGRVRQSSIPSLTGIRFLKGDRLSDEV